MKSGSGDDLWNNDTNDEEEESTATERTTSTKDKEETEATSDTVTGTIRENKATTIRSESAEQKQPYIVRRAIQNKSVQFERDERLTFFVHDDVIEGERELLTDIESEFGRDVPKFDIREAVYRAALQNPDDVLNELLKMGYLSNQE